MVEEFKSGLQITEDIMLGKATWDKLFQPPNFFMKYRYVPTFALVWILHQDFLFPVTRGISAC